MKVIIILGTRPEIIKMAPIILELRKKKIAFEIIHTGQHYSQNMDQIFWDSFQLPMPKYRLGIQEKTHARQVAEMLKGIDDVILEEKPDFILVHGDTNSTLAGSITASKHPHIRLVHVEAGLRSYDRKMPEEVNRVLTDHVSSILLAPTTVAKRNLLREGISSKKIFVVGNTVEDILLHRLKIALKSSSILNTMGLAPKSYSLVTIHRQENTENTEQLGNTIQAVSMAAKSAQLSVVFPIHPRTQDRLKQVAFVFPSNVILSEPIGYDDFLVLEKNAALIVTDSGGIQEEACILKVPTITLRENTERPETLKIKANVLVGTNPRRITSHFKKMLRAKPRWKSPYGNGTAAQKIVALLLRFGKMKI